MSLSSPSASSRSNKADSVTRISSPLGQRLSQIVFWVVLLSALILTIQAIVPSIEYFRWQASRDIGDESVWSSIYAWGVFAARSLIRLIFLGIGVLIYWRMPHERISILTSIFLIGFGSGGIHYSQYVSDAFAYTEEHNLLLVWPLQAIGWILVFMYFIYFPDGRPIPAIARFHIIPVCLINAAFFAPLDSRLYPLNWNPLLLVPVFLYMFGVSFGSQIYRYRKLSTRLQRQQTRWVVAGFLVAILIVLSTSVSISGEPKDSVRFMMFTTLGDGAFVLIPITLGLAIFRYRLWDLDLIINRSAAYVVFAGVAVALFFIVLFALQLVIGQTQPLIAGLIAAGCSALVFQPLHQRVQSFVDRRIYGLRFEIDALRAKQQIENITNHGVLSGKTLGKYQILDTIGKGGMGEVYKATDGTTMYAVKTLLTGSTNNPEFVSRFKREGEVGQRLNHPNIAGVHEIEQDATTGTLYLVMDYLEGEDLSVLLKRDKRLPLEAITQIIGDLAAALDTAHAEGLVHRDIKPSNVMIIPQEDANEQKAILMDFGITKLKDANTLTGTGAIGTIGYMAPEQILDARAVDLYADIYALGVMTYEMLLGELPFTGGAGQVMFAHIQQPPPDPRDKDSDVPRIVAKAIMTALAKDPSERFASAGDFAQALTEEVPVA